jgi:hypothetical protein
VEEDSETEQTGPRPFLDLTVGEVSLVDKPAIKKTFLVVKRDSSGDAAAENNETSEDDMGANSPVPTIKPVKKGAVDPEVLTVTEDVAKAVGGSLKAVITDKLDLAKSKLQGVADGIGTMKKAEVCDAIWDAYDLMMGAKHDLVPISKSLGVDQEIVAKNAAGKKKKHQQYVEMLEKQVAKAGDDEDGQAFKAWVETVKVAGFPADEVETETVKGDATEQEVVEKAAKRFTKKRVAALKSASAAIDGIIKEIEPEAADDTDSDASLAATLGVTTTKTETETMATETTETNKGTTGAAPVQVTVVIPQEFTDVLKSLKEGQDKLATAVTDLGTKQTETIKKQEEVEKRVGELEGTPNSDGGATETDTVKKNQRAPSLFAGVV